MSADSRRCPNCEAPLADPPPRFCPECGQETRVRAPTLGEFLQQFGGAYLSTEGALWRTLKLLLLKPGELTRQYLAGRRKHYVLPLRLYLTISVVVLLVLRLVTSAAIQADPKLVAQFDGRPESVVFDIGTGRAGLRDGKYFCEGLPGWICSRLQRRLDVDAKGLQRELAGLGERLMGSLGAAMFLLLPAFAAALRLAYWNRGLRYTEHLVFALHVHAFWFAVLALNLLPLGGFEQLSWFAVPVYTLMAMKRVYGGRWWPRWLRAAAVSTVYLLVMVLAMTALTVWAALS